MDDLDIRIMNMIMLVICFLWILLQRRLKILGLKDGLVLNGGR